jgi:hypothetical protein
MHPVAGLRLQERRRCDILVEAARERRAADALAAQMPERRPAGATLQRAVQRAFSWLANCRTPASDRQCPATNP